METTKAVTYYACSAIHGTKKSGILLVTKEQGKPSVQTWTGEEFAKWKAAVARMSELNQQLLGVIYTADGLVIPATLAEVRS